MPTTAIKKQITLENFDEVVYQQNRRKVVSIRKYRKEKFINKLILGVICFGMIYILFISALRLSSQVVLKSKEDTIRKYETILQKKKIENEQLEAKIDEIVIDKGIKQKAILELSMTKPTKDHIIYFNSTNREFVHYDK